MMFYFFLPTTYHFSCPLIIDQCWWVGLRSLPGHAIPEHRQQHVLVLIPSVQKSVELPRYLERDASILQPRVHQGRVDPLHLNHVPAPALKRDSASGEFVEGRVPARPRRPPQHPEGQHQLWTQVQRIWPVSKLVRAWHIVCVHFWKEHFKSFSGCFHMFLPHFITL